MDKQALLAQLESRLKIVFNDDNWSSRRWTTIGISADWRDHCMNCAYGNLGRHNPTPGEILAISLAVRETGLEPTRVAEKLKESGHDIARSVT